MQKRAAIYARISTTDQKSLGKQLDQMKSYIASRNWLHVKQVEEIALGAKTRPKRQELLRMARRREIDVIVVWKLDRWGRSVSDVTATLNEPRASVSSPSQGAGFYNCYGKSNGRTFIGDLLRERVKWGLENARKKGIRIGRPATEMKKRGKVMALYNQGLNLSEIANKVKTSRRSMGRILEAETQPNNF